MFICTRKYNYIKTFFKDKAVNKNVCNLVEDIEVFADNTQKKGGTAWIKEDSTASIGITTNVVILQFNYKSEIQQNDFSPDKWLCTTTDDNETLLKIQEIESRLSTNYPLIPTMYHAIVYHYH